MNSYELGVKAANLAVEMATDRGQKYGERGGLLGAALGGLGSLGFDAYSNHVNGKPLGSSLNGERALSVGLGGGVLGAGAAGLYGAYTGAQEGKLVQKAFPHAQSKRDVILETLSAGDPENMSGLVISDDEGEREYNFD